MVRLLLVAWLLAFGTLACEQQSAKEEPGPAASASAHVGQLDERFEPLVTDFNAAADKVRVLALLSPT